MHILILAAAPLKEDFLRAATDEYLLRLRPYTSAKVEETTPAKVLHVLARIKPGSRVIVLDESGELWSSREIATYLKTSVVSGIGTVIFCIGGPDGHPPEVLATADLVLSLSRLTFTHGIARLLILEQVYRAFRIMRGEPYHR